MSLDVVFVPGFLCDERLFSEQVEALSDLPGVGSVTVADISAQASIEAMADAVLDEASERFAVAGLSLGAIVATEVAHRAPDRVDGVAVLDGNLAAPDSDQLAARTEWAARVRAGDLFRVVVDELVEPLTHDVGRHASLIIDMALRAGPDTFVRQNDALLHRHDRRNDLAELSLPVLIACGREDQLCPPDIHRDLAERTPQAELIVVDDAGHLATIDQPATLTSVLRDWLTRCDSNGHSSRPNHPNQPTNTTNHRPTGGTSNEYTTA